MVAIYVEKSLVRKVTEYNLDTLGLEEVRLPDVIAGRPGICRSGGV
jgi:hypothetical protein